MARTVRPNIFPCSEFVAPKLKANEPRASEGRVGCVDLVCGKYAILNWKILPRTEGTVMSRGFFA